MQIAFREEVLFNRVRDALFGGDALYRALQAALLENPRRGDLIPGSGGARKVRWQDPQRGMGRRGGLRILYYYREEAGMIYFLLAYDKNTPDITPAQKRMLRQIIEAIRKEPLP